MQAPERLLESERILSRITTRTGEVELMPPPATSIQYSVFSIQYSVSSFQFPKLRVCPAYDDEEMN